MWRCERQKQSMVAPGVTAAWELWRIGSVARTRTEWLGSEQEKTLPGH